MKLKKRILSILLAAILICTAAPSTFAASDEAVTAANSLYSLGLFSGTGTDASGKPVFDLDRALTRNEAVTMLVRLLGKEDEAKSKTWEIPFIDVAEWAKPYVGYAYANKLTGGTSATTFGGSDQVSATQYLTFVLRALGYKSGVDFQWDKAWELSDQLGITRGQYNAASSFTRGDTAIVSYSALSQRAKDLDITLIQSLKNCGAVTQSAELTSLLSGSGGILYYSEYPWRMSIFAREQPALQAKTKTRSIGYIAMSSTMNAKRPKLLAAIPAFAGTRIFSGEYLKWLYEHV